MKITTTRFGEIEVEENLIFDFVEPILGYEQIDKYVLVDHMPDSPFKWLQALNDPNIAFPVTFPGFFGLNYQFMIPEEDAKKIGLDNAEKLLSFNIVCIPAGKPEDTTINLVGPIIVNSENRKGMQLVLVNSNYSVRHKLFSAKSKNDSEQESREVEKVEK